MRIKSIIAAAFLMLTGVCYSQTLTTWKPDPKKEAMFLPYLAVRHGGMSTIQEWKKNNSSQYHKELWYYSESFYVKRDHLAQGVTLDESIIDISRFESSRKQDEDSYVILPGFKDALVLIP